MGRKRGILQTEIMPLFCLFSSNFQSFQKSSELLSKNWRTFYCLVSNTEQDDLSVMYFNQAPDVVQILLKQRAFSILMQNRNNVRIKPYLGWNFLEFFKIGRGYLSIKLNICLMRFSKKFTKTFAATHIYKISNITSCCHHSMR